MSFDMCHNCRYVGYCTFPRQGAVTECDEYEYMSEAPAFDWDLSEFMKLAPQPKDEPEKSR